MKVKEFEEIENSFNDNKNTDWSKAINIGERIINDNSNDVYIYIRALYIYHNILVEENYSENESNKIEKLLIDLFKISFEKFKDNADNQFYIGKILYVSEWYFGINDDLKPINQRLAFQMQERAFKSYPNNKLFEWAYLFSLGDGKFSRLAKELISNSELRENLLSFGFAGKYIFQSIKSSIDN